MARTTPSVENGTLVDPTGAARPIAVGSPDWYVWLTQATRFAFVDSGGRFTARKERGGRADGYWRAYRKRDGKVSIVYLGKSADLTLVRLQDAAATLIGPSRPDNEPVKRHVVPPVSEGTPSVRRPPTFPTGTVTFLFADIDERATFRTNNRQTMHDLLCTATAILQPIVTTRGGSIFDVSGERVGVAFANPLDAIRAALDAQHALRVVSEAIGPFPVRMALHTGVVHERAGTSSSHAVRQGRLLLAAGHAARILLSHVTQELVRDGLPAEIGLRDLGAYILGEQGHPEHLFHLVVPGMPTDFPPLRSPARRPHNLPLRVTPLIGRDWDVAAVVAALHRADVRLVTLTGIGGVGKTSVGLQAAAELRDTFADGVFFVDLAALRDAALVVPTIAHTLGVADAGDQPTSAFLRDYLTSKQLLLMLDNFEQVMPAATALATLLAGAAEIKLIVTSRAPLHLAGEHEFLVAPLPWADQRERLNTEQADAESSTFPPAVALFVQRAQAVRPDLGLTPDTAPLIGRICERLDGLPLAIELAAARVRLFPLTALLHRLERRLPLLTGGARDLPARQQTLRATIEWSFQLLDPQAQTLLRRLAVFAGGFTLDAAEAVCGGSELGDRSWGSDSAAPPPVLDGLAALVDQNLLRPIDDGADTPRFAMLDLIREYAQERLEQCGEAIAIQQRHAAYFLHLAERIEPDLHSANARTWLNRLEVEHANLRSTLTWALEQGEVELAARLASALTVFWDVRHRREGCDWLAGVLDHAGSLSPVIRARALQAAGWLAHLLYDRARAHALLQEGLELYRTLSDERRYTTTLTELGWTMVEYGDDLPRAIELLQAGLARYRALGDQRGIALALHGLGWAEQQRALGSRQGVIAILTGVSWVERQPGILDAARALHIECLAIRRAAGDAPGAVWSLLSLGVIAGAQHDYAAARAYQQERLAIERSLDNHHGVADALRSLGMLALRQDDYGAARAWLVEGLQLARAIGDTLCVALALIGLGEVAQVEGDLARASELLEEALVHFRTLGDSHWMARVYAMLAQVALSGHDDAATRSMAMQSLQLAGSVDDPETISACLAGMADSAARQGRYEWAARLWGAAERQGENPQVYLTPVEPSDRPRLLAAARAALGEETFAAAWAAGRALTPEEAVTTPNRAAMGAGATIGQAAPPRPAGLTHRELEVLLLVAEGLSNAAIAERLIISIETVKTYLRAIYAKLGVASRTAAMRYVIDHRLS